MAIASRVPAARTGAADGAHARNAVPAGRVADGVVPLLPDGDHREVGGYRRAQPTGGTAGSAFEVVRVARGAEERPVGIGAAQFAEGRLGKDDGRRPLAAAP